MGLPKTIRLDDALERKVEEYIDTNGIKFSQLVTLAVTKFISEPQSIELTPVKKRVFMEAAERVFRKHKDTMDKLG